VTPFIEAAQAAGARRALVQSISFVTAPIGPPVQDESAPLYLDAPTDLRPAVETIHHMESDALAVEGIETLVLRYGFFYGPGTWYERDGAMGRMIAKRQYPMFGDGGGLWSWIHVDDAADATIRAMTAGEPGVYNITGDDPVSMNEWVPVVVDALGAKKPRRLPTFLVRLAAGNGLVYYGTELRGASNEKAKAELGIAPRPWREGLREAFA
jgi:nucleoside-diphosphate-sugar epimerase